MLAVDRPGYGRSTAHPDRTYRDFAADVEELADHLGLGRFAVVGFSSGGPHALACAALLGPERVVAAGSVSSDAPYHQLGLVEQIYGVADVTLSAMLPRKAKVASGMRASYGGMKREERRDAALADLDEATAQGYEGAASDAVLEAAESWGFELENIACPVLLWNANLVLTDTRRVVANHESAAPCPCSHMRDSEAYMQVATPPRMVRDAHLCCRRRSTHANRPLRRSTHTYYATHTHHRSDAQARG